MSFIINIFRLLAKDTKSSKINIILIYRDDIFTIDLLSIMNKANEIAQINIDSNCSNSRPKYDWNCGKNNTIKVAKFKILTSIEK
jgi:hypothetical protein